MILLWMITQMMEDQSLGASLFKEGGYVTHGHGLED
jgi:hypothetical protein